MRRERKTKEERVRRKPQREIKKDPWGGGLRKSVRGRGMKKRKKDKGSGGVLEKQSSSIKRWGE